LVARVKHHICSVCCSWWRPPDGTLAGVGESAAEGVQVLALVELPGDAPPVGLVGQIPGGVDGTAQCPVLLDRAGQRVLLPPRGAQFADHQRRGGVPALHAGRDPQQVVPHRRDQLAVEAAGQQRPAARVPVGEVLPWPGPVQGDLAEIPDAWGELPVHQVEQRKVRQRRASGVGGVLEQRQVGLVAEQAVEHVVAFRPVATMTLVLYVECWSDAWV
jgi:hypothetical protein